MAGTYNANVRIRDLPRSVDDGITALARKRNCHKWEVIKHALEAYVENHKDEILETR